MAYENGKHEDVFIPLKNGCSDREKGELIAGLIEQYTPLIKGTIRVYVTLDPVTAKSAALKGFLEGIEKYDCTSNADFAYVAKNYMRSALQKAYRDDRTIHIPHNVLEQVEWCTRRGLLNKDQSEMTPQELEMYLGIEEVLPTLNSVGLDAPVVGSEGESTIQDTVSQDTFASPDAGCYMNDVHESLKRLLNQLPEKEKIALIHLNGLFGEEKKTSRQVGAMIGLSHQGAVNNNIRGMARLKELMLDTEKDLVDNFPLEGIKAYEVSD